MTKISKPLIHELKHHLPFTALASFFAILITLLTIQYTKNINETIFESLHILHLIASSIVTAGIFYKYKKNPLYAFLIGIFGAIIIGSLSDIIFPWLGSLIFGLHTHFHLPLIEIPIIIFLSAGIGSLIGMLTLKTKIPHLLHVGISVFASLFYLITYTPEISFLFFTLSFLIILLSVIIPCCISDILFPFFFLGKKIKNCTCK
jgi:predicted membrane protein